MDDVTAQPCKPRGKWNAPLILAIILTVGFFSALWFVMLTTLPVGSERVIDMLMGSLVTVWIGSMHFFFNTTENSQKKTDLLARAQPIDTEVKP